MVRGDAAHHCSREFDMDKGQLARMRGYCGPETGFVVDLGGVSAITQGIPVGPLTETLGDYVSAAALAQDVERHMDERARRAVCGAMS
ncbi:hypothetical protein [Novosphingobium sp. TCA1]|nr:hypothetical protein [Novosphingobium sp. TCA1]GFE75797.1 hypothetical protein NTCA1_34460 [Novosphingobium sp. TCA1]